MEILHQARLRAIAAPRRRRARSAAKQGRALILYYHRIASPSLDPWRTSVSPEAFASHLELFQSEMRVLPLAELVAALRRGKIPDRAVSLTFDDGYVDNLEQALPRLERHGLPAMFYIPTGLIGTRNPLWWDELADLMLGPGPRPVELDVDLGGTGLRLPTRTVAEREHAFYDEVNGALKMLPPAAVDAAMEQLRAWADRDSATPRLSEDGISEPRPMNLGELERLAAHELAEIGSHTALHPCMPRLPPSDQLSELVASRKMLAELGLASRSFAYPFGDNDRSSRQAVREAGFDHAVGVQEYMPVTVAAPEFEIPRMMVFEESAAQLERRMAAVLAFAGDR